MKFKTLMEHNFPHYDVYFLTPDVKDSMMTCIHFMLLFFSWDHTKNIALRRDILISRKFTNNEIDHQFVCLFIA